MNNELDRRVTAARIPMPDDWTPTAATHCSECGDELKPDRDRVWSRDHCAICRAEINRREMYL